LSQSPHDTTDLDLWSTARLTASAERSDSRIVFGYGSLIWKVDFPYERRFPCHIHGPFARRFWQKSADHRGTLEFRGRVATLIRRRRGELAESEGHSGILGVAYVIPQGDVEKVLAQLDFRERHGYTRDIATVVDTDGTSYQSHVYYNAGEGGACVWEEPVETTAAVVARASGPSGSNLEYVRMLAHALRDLSIDGSRDEYLEELLSSSEALWRARPSDIASGNRAEH